MSFGQRVKETLPDKGFGTGESASASDLTSLEMRFVPVHPGNFVHDKSAPDYNI